MSIFLVWNKGVCVHVCMRGVHVVCVCVRVRYVHDVLVFSTRQQVMYPFILLNRQGQYDVKVKVHSGGMTG